MSNAIISDLQKKELEILKYFQGFCNKYNLMFYVCGGGLIGTVRHKGFIPWDDDLDIFMPRKDYERLANLWNENADIDKYVYCRTTKTENYHDAGASIRDKQTTFINRHSVNDDICHGVALEIMPIDGCPNGKIKRKKQLFFAMLFALFNVQRLPDNKGKYFRFFAKLLYTLVPFNDIRYYIWKFSEEQMTKYSWDETTEVTELIGSLKGMLIRHPKEVFSSVKYLPFEDTYIPVMKGYKRYLKLIFGDYMILPPENERRGKHDVVHIDLHNGYDRYRGIYYLKEK